MLNKVRKYNMNSKHLLNSHQTEIAKSDTQLEAELKSIIHVLSN